MSRPVIAEAQLSLTTQGRTGDQREARGRIQRSSAEACSLLAPWTLGWIPV